MSEKNCKMMKKIFLVNVLFNIKKEGVQMNRFKCPKCKRNQYSTSRNENTACIYCDNPKVNMMDTLDEVPGEDERKSENENT